VSETIVGFVLLVVAGIMGGMLAEPVVRWNGRRLAKASTFHCGIRVVSGQFPGFANTWRHGSTTFDHGVIQFEDEVIRVTELDSHARQPTADELWWTSFDSRVVLVTAETAVLELAVRTPQLEAIRLRLTSALHASR
jgi:hypothetical protein